MYYLEANNIVKQYASRRALDKVRVHVPEHGKYPQMWNTSVTYPKNVDSTKR